jgi:excisionase family DNA binding protein
MSKKSVRLSPRNKITPAVIIPSDAALLTVPETAAFLRVSVSTVRSWVLSKKHIPYHKLGDSIRFRRVDVEAFVSRNVIAPTNGRAA